MMSSTAATAAAAGITEGRAGRAAERTAVIVDGIGLISASNKHTKFGGVVLALRD